MIATVEALTYTYPGAAASALSDVSASIEAGQVVLVAGESGGGKSTLLRVFNGLVPQFYGGRYRGSVRVAGLDPAVTPARRMATLAGMVFQEPEAQGVADMVEDEISFGMEQLGLPRQEMLARTASLLAEQGIEHLRHRRLATLSGGERQRVAITAVMALEPRLLLLDEPASQLDATGAASVARALQALAARGVAVLVAEHRHEHFLPLADTVWHVEAGQLATLAPGRFGRPPEASFPDPLPPPGGVIVAASGLSVAYPGGGGIDAVDFTLREGEVVALAGPNGSGKTTLLRALAGLEPLSAGTVAVDGRPAPDAVSERSAVIGLVPQDPALALFGDTVRDELRDSLKRRPGAPPVDAALAAWDLGQFAGRNPRDLSVGQQERVAIAAMLAHAPRVWLLDEPTRGADQAMKRWLGEALRRHAAAGGAAVVATHDLRWAASIASRVVELDDCRVVADHSAPPAFTPSPATAGAAIS